MAIRDEVRKIFKISRKTFLYPSAWIDLNGLINQNSYLYTTLKNTFSAPTGDKPETFEEVVKRQGLTEKDLKEGAATYRALAIVFVILGLISLVYAFKLILNSSSILGMILGLAVTALFLAQAFRYDFWALQMRERRLGLTFQDWKKHYLGK